MMDIASLPPIKIKIETTASMQEQLARRDHRIAVLESVCAAQKYRITVLEAREGGPPQGNSGGHPMMDAGTKFNVPDGGTTVSPPSHSLALSRAIAADKPLDAYGRR